MLPSPCSLKYPPTGDIQIAPLPAWEPEPCPSRHGSDLPSWPTAAHRSHNTARYPVDHCTYWPSRIAPVYVALRGSSSQSLSSTGWRPEQCTVSASYHTAPRSRLGWPREGMLCAGLGVQREGSRARPEQRDPKESEHTAREQRPV